MKSKFLIFIVIIFSGLSAASFVRGCGKINEVTLEHFDNRIDSLEIRLINVEKNGIYTLLNTDTLKVDVKEVKTEIQEIQEEIQKVREGQNIIYNVVSKDKTVSFWDLF